jgi:aromatic-amino-acid transaminase
VRTAALVVRSGLYFSALPWHLFATVKLLPPRNDGRPGDDPIFALNKKAQLRKATGAMTINATVGALLEDDGTLAVLPSVIETLRSVATQKMAAYAPISGDPQFLQAVIDDLLAGSSLRDIAVAAATPGGTGALRHAMSVFTEKNDAVVTANYYWGPYATIADEHERRLVTFAMFASDGAFDTEAFAKCLHETAQTQGRVLVFLNDPCHNPTGYSMSDEEWAAVSEALVAQSKRVPTTVLADVAYLAFARDQKSFLKYLEPVAESGLLCFAWSGSKGFSLYGQRVGALIACTQDSGQRDAVQRALTYACRGTWSNCNASGMDTVRRCLTEPSIAANVIAERERLRTLLDARVQAFNTHAKGTKLRYPRYDGGFFVTVFTDDSKKAMSTLESKGVFVVPGSGSLRVALCSVAERDINALVQALNEAI